MIRLQPTAVRMTPNELKDIENRSRYRRYLRQQNNGPLFAGKVMQRDRTTPVNVIISQGGERLLPSTLGEEEELASDLGDRQSGEDGHTDSSLDQPLGVKPLVFGQDAQHPLLRSVRRGGLFRHPAVTEEDCNRDSESSKESHEPSTMDFDIDSSRQRPATLQQPGPRNLPPPFSAVPRAMPVPDKRSHQSMETALPTQLTDIDEGDGSSMSRPDRIMSAIRSLSIRATRGPRRRSPDQVDLEANTMTAGEILAATMNMRPTTPHFPIYNDTLPTMTQPQTPQHLPESRHQSRFRGAYTAPAGRQQPVPASETPTGQRGQRRGRSPRGMSRPGFQGLYGGSENAEDET